MQHSGNATDFSVHVTTKNIAPSWQNRQMDRQTAAKPPQELQHNTLHTVHTQPFTHLHALPVLGASVEDVFARLVASHEADGAHCGGVAQEVHRVHATVHDLTEGWRGGGG